jgi:O-antigen/teichoic acid export membrane protein
MTSEHHHRLTFFRQGGWMVSATVLSGVCMFAVHIFAPWLGDQEFGLFGTLLAMINVMMIPALGLQTVFAQQAAAAVSEEDRQRLAGTIHALLLGTFVLWMAMAVLVIGFRHELLMVLTIRNPVALCIIVAVGLLQLWLPILLGVLQGQQNFLWLGGALILNGIIRFAAVGIIVVILGGLATGAIGGVFAGILIAFSIAAFQTRRAWWQKGLAFDWRGWLARVLPLTIGLGTSQFIFSVDMIFIRAIFGEDQTGYYSAAGMIGRGMVVFTLPLSVVMFPKVVQSLSHGKRTHVFAYTLATTIALGILAASGCTAMAWGLRWLVLAPEVGIPGLEALANLLRPFTEAVVVIARLIPWFVWSMLPLCASNVMLNNLLARRQFSAVPCLAVVAAGYAAALGVFGESFVRVIQILGLFNLVFLGVLAAFTWRDRQRVREQYDGVIVAPL